MVCTFVNMMGLYTGGLIFGWAYAQGYLYWGGGRLIVRGLWYITAYMPLLCQHAPIHPGNLYSPFLV